MENINQAGYTADGFEQETVDERIEALLEMWGVETDVDPDSRAADDLRYERQRAYDLAVSYPTEVVTDLFLEIVAARAAKRG